MLDQDTSIVYNYTKLWKMELYKAEKTSHGVTVNQRYLRREVSGIVKAVKPGSEIKQNKNQGKRVALELTRQISKWKLIFEILILLENKNVSVNIMKAGVMKLLSLTNLPEKLVLLLLA